MKYKYIIFDFDGVLADTNAIRIEGFRTLFQEYPREEVQRMVEYAKKNGGISRYKKIRHFFEDIRRESVTETDVQMWAGRYSQLVKQKVIDAAAIEGSVNFLAAHHHDYAFTVISGSDQVELRDVCHVRGIDRFFVEILGSPLSKEENIQKLLQNQGWEKKDGVLIGDTMNDFNAAKAAGIDFIGMNSGMVYWKGIAGVRNIDDFFQLSPQMSC